MSYNVERALALLYSLASCASVICCVTSGILWSHWRHVLNACPTTNCGCYLNARSTYTAFEGGHIGYCHYATYGLLLPLIFAIVFAIYHVYRVCFGKVRPRKGTTTLCQRSGDVVVVTTESEISYDGISPYYWTPCSIIAVLLAVYNLVYASVFTAGYDVTCTQYRETLLKEIQSVGNLVHVIKSRLSCSAIFDFMDYLIESTSYERRIDGRINTAICIHFTLIFAWTAVLAWSAIATINIVQAKRSSPARV